jgi:fructosamine-3-kinase
VVGQRHGHRAGYVLIDPAAHGGHRITDLAMLALFGAPYLEVILAAYESASRWLPPRWRDLIGLHQLHRLLVHAGVSSGVEERRIRLSRRRAQAVDLAQERTYLWP